MVLGKRSIKGQNCKKGGQVCGRQRAMRDGVMGDINSGQVRAISCILVSCLHLLGIISQQQPQDARESETECQKSVRELRS